jgi:hypothetical protein
MKEDLDLQTQFGVHLKEALSCIEVQEEEHRVRLISWIFWMILIHQLNVQIPDELADIVVVQIEENSLLEIVYMAVEQIVEVTLFELVDMAVEQIVEVALLEPEDFHLLKMIHRFLCFQHKD